MGHNTLGVLPRSVRWREVVASLQTGTEDREVVAASARAAETDLLRAGSDPVFIEAVRLLLSIPFAARSEDFGRALRDAGLPVGNRPELLDLIGATTERLNATRRETRTRSDFGEIAARALTRTLSTTISEALPGLFDATPDDLQAIARRLSWSKGISGYARDFFGNLVSGSLSYWLDRTLALQVGQDRRFATVAARADFDRQLDQCSSEATRIIN